MANRGGFIFANLKAAMQTRFLELIESSEILQKRYKIKKAGLILEIRYDNAPDGVPVFLEANLEDEGIPYVRWTDTDTIAERKVFNPFSSNPTNPSESVLPVPLTAA